MVMDGLEQSPVRTGSDGIDYEVYCLEHILTGHIKKDDDCGTCDGGACHCCSELWRVGEMGETELFPYPHLIKYENFWSEQQDAIDQFNALCRGEGWFW